MLFVVRAGRSRDMRKSRPAAQLASAGMARKGPMDGGASPTYRPHRPLLDVRCAGHEVSIVILNIFHCSFYQLKMSAV